MGMPPLPWERLHDTMFMVFLDDPHAASHGLKQSAARLLGMPPEERDAVKDWLVAQGIVTKASKNWGAFISKAPGDLVGRYANGDVIRTEKLFKLLWPSLKKRGMLEAYDRERQLMPILLDMERQGVDVDVARLTADVARGKQDLTALDAWVLRRLKIKSLNIDSGASLVDALVAAGKVDVEALGKTPTGAWKTDKAALARAITDSTLAAALAHRASLSTCLGTFMEPWLLTATASGGLIYTGWNQLKQYYGTATRGAVTGRMSSSPNFQNIPKEFAPIWKHQDKSLPKCPLDLAPLPLVRSYIVAPPGYVLIDRDYSQQELRILAHFEDGDLLQAYQSNVWMDVHRTVMGTINDMLKANFSRSVIKQINFGLIYGMGVALMAQKAGCETEEARSAKHAVLSIYPGLRELINGLKELAANNQALRTWGGRRYHCEPPKMIDGQIREFSYKMLNVLVQGSAADCTKEAMIRYYNSKPKGHRLLLQVHDELLGAVPAGDAVQGMEIMREAMELAGFEVPMLSEGKMSATNWAELRPYDKEGVVL